VIRKILIANRGEIACRIIRTARGMGIATVAVYSDADRHALHVEMADEAVHIGGSKPGESYLNIDAILDAVKRSRADAVHPGYGFLAENAEFGYGVRSAYKTWIGPPPEAIEAMGDKRIAKLLLQDVPYVPGYIGEDQSDTALTAAAGEIGFPIMVKATAGGGGKGMRLVRDAASLPDALAAARREAAQAFGNDRLMLERAILNPRHVEIQIVGDQYGKVIALGERECSIQRRHQKIIEEAPSTALTPDLRAAMCATAVSIGEQLGYYNAGTVEFLLDEAGNYYFMEMNTRLQVEHPVTEAVYGVDLVHWQIEIARGTPLVELLPPGSDPDTFGLHPQGHAVEVRVYAEDPTRDFLPSTGPVLYWQDPSGVRTDSGIRSGDTVTTFYDPMIAKIIAHGSHRLEALRKLDYALSQTILLGLRNNIAFLRRVLLDHEHMAGLISTNFLPEHPQLLRDSEDLPHLALIAAAIQRTGQQATWRNNPNRPIRQTFVHADKEHTLNLQPRRGGWHIEIGEDAYHVHLVRQVDFSLWLEINGHRQRAVVVTEGEATWVHTASGISLLKWVSPLPNPGERTAAEGSLRAPMPGQVVKVTAEVGQAVNQGDLLMILEAMKMEHRIEAPYAGTVDDIAFRVGDTVPDDAVLLTLTAASKQP